MSLLGRLLNVARGRALASRRPPAPTTDADESAPADGAAPAEAAPPVAPQAEAPRPTAPRPRRL